MNTTAPPASVLSTALRLARYADRPAFAQILAAANELICGTCRTLAAAVARAGLAETDAATPFDARELVIDITLLYSSTGGTPRAFLQRVRDVAMLEVSKARELQKARRKPRKPCPALPAAARTQPGIFAQDNKRFATIESWQAPAHAVSGKLLLEPMGSACRGN